MRRTLLVFIAAMITCIHVVTCTFHPPECFIELSRVIGVGSRNRYSLLCKCSPLVAKAILFASAPQRETAGRNNATVHCIARSQGDLTRMCNNLNGTEFRRLASPVLDRCVNNPKLTPDDAKATEPFTFKKEACVSKFAWSQDVQVASIAWVCECIQFEFYEVNPGWTRYQITGNAKEAAQEFEAMRTCAVEATEQMQEVCTNSPTDYDILGLHLMQMCCKRTRVNSESKFECAAVVPDDLSQWKVTP